MTYKWNKTNYKGIRYRIHPTRKHGKQRDKYYVIRYQTDGERIEEGLGWLSDGWTLDKAVTELSKLRESAKKGDGPARLGQKRKIESKRKKADETARLEAEKENVTFGCFMTENYLPQCQRDKKEKTYINEEGLYRLHLAGTIGELPFRQISAFYIERIKQDMARSKLSARTIQYVLQLIRQVFHVARKLGVYEGESPTRNVRWPKLDNMKLRYLSAKEAERLLNALATKSKTLHDAALLSLHCGLRFGEIANLKWSCVNWDAGTLAILNAKAGSRIAYLTEPAKEMLKQRELDKNDKLKHSNSDEMKSGNTDELIFKKRSGKEGPMAQASKVFNDVVDTLKLNKGVTDAKQRITFHSLRHSYATHLYESTHDLYLTQRSLGHTTGEMTKRYAKMNEGRLREGAAAIEKALAAGGKNKQEPKQAVDENIST